MTKRTSANQLDASIEALLTKVQTIEDWKGRPVKVLPMEGEEAKAAMDKIQAKYSNVDASKGIFIAIEESGKRLVWANCTENSSEAIGFVRTSDLFQVRFGPTARANRPSKARKGGKQAEMLKALAERLED